MILRFSLPLLCLAMLPYTAVRAKAIDPVVAACAERLWSEANQPDAAFINSATLGFVLRNAESATIVARGTPFVSLGFSPRLMLGIFEGRPARKALVGVDGVNMPPDLHFVKDSLFTTVFSGPRESVLKQVAELDKAFDDVSYQVKYAHELGAALDVGAEVKTTSFMGQSGANLAKILKSRVDTPVQIKNLGDGSTYFAFTNAQMADLDRDMLWLLKIGVVALPLAQVATFPGSGAWIIRGDHHAVASEAAAELIRALARHDQAQRLNFADAELRQILEACPKESCSTLEALPTDLDPVGVIDYLTGRFNVDAEPDGAAELMLDKIFALYLPGQTRESPLRFNDARLTLDQKVNWKASKARVADAWQEVLTKVAALPPPVVTPPEESPPDETSIAAPVKIAKPRATRVPVKRKAVDVAPPVSPGAEPEPVSAPELTDIAETLPADPTAPALAITPIFRNFVGPDRALDGDTIEAIFSFLKMHKVRGSLSASGGVRQTFLDALYNLRGHSLSIREFEYWRGVMNAVPFGKQDYAKLLKNDPDAMRAMVQGWRVLQSALQDHEIGKPITRAEVDRVDVLYREREWAFDSIKRTDILRTRVAEPTEGLQLSTQAKQVLLSRNLSNGQIGTMIKKWHGVVMTRPKASGDGHQRYTILIHSRGANSPDEGFEALLDGDTVTGIRLSNLDRSEELYATAATQKDIVDESVNIVIPGDIEDTEITMPARLLAELDVRKGITPDRVRTTLTKGRFMEGSRDNPCRQIGLPDSTIYIVCFNRGQGPTRTLKSFTEVPFVMLERDGAPSVSH